MLSLKKLIAKILSLQTGTFTYATNFTDYNANDPIQVTKSLHTVNIVGAFKNTANVEIPWGDGTVLVGTLQEGFRPRTTVYAIHQGSGAAIWLMQIRVNGQLYIGRYRTAWSSGTYSAGTNTWFPFNVSFIAA